MPNAIIVVDHGSRREEANQMLNELCAQVREMTEDRVYPAHMELAEPTIRQSFNAAVADGADSIFIFPYFLSPGRHSREDIPRFCAEAAVRHPHVQWHCSGPIGLDPIMAELILRRADHCHRSQHQCNDCPDERFCRPFPSGEDLTAPFPG